MERVYFSYTTDAYAISRLIDNPLSILAFQANRDLRNALLLLTTGLREAEVTGGDLTSGMSVSAAMSNLTFNSSGGEVRTDVSGEVMSYFTIYDYHPQTDSFRAVLEVR